MRREDRGLCPSKVPTVETLDWDGLSLAYLCSLPHAPQCLLVWASRRACSCRRRGAALADRTASRGRAAELIGQDSGSL